MRKMVKFYGEWLPIILIVLVVVGNIFMVRDLEPTWILCLLYRVGLPEGTESHFRYELIWHSFILVFLAWYIISLKREVNNLRHSRRDRD